MTPDKRASGAPDQAPSVYHWPRFYRYEVSAVVRRRWPRIVPNRYGWQVIGLAAVVGRYAFCVKWSRAR